MKSILIKPTEAYYPKRQYACTYFNKLPFQEMDHCNNNLENNVHIIQKNLRYNPKNHEHLDLLLKLSHDQTNFVLSFYCL